MLRKKAFRMAILDDKNFRLPHKIRNFSKVQIQFIVAGSGPSTARCDTL
jgi:hypothetical protein